GIVGEDGETHQGAFDVSYLRPIPNIHLMAPRDGATLQRALEFAVDFDHPIALRYPRGPFILEEGVFPATPFELGKGELLVDGGEMLFIGYGNGVGRAYETMKLLDQKIALLDLRFVKPLDTALLEELAGRFKRWYIFSDSAKMGGVASALEEFLDERGLCIDLITFEYPDRFIPHGKVEAVEESLGLRPDQLAKRIAEIEAKNS
ncbi:MAG: 1-deoxy-D-xylulose-5-phosphate synthase, partial [Epsilonproteobacteria bacterium]|nr:1-deoxy-D-xylulose-5-phosphate synthase [Campylobacterota bacterium]NPA83435.1 1-deoxy-D-xylulose-5-phosphate synthase [Campylobacterota bacterium]